MIEYNEMSVLTVEEVKMLVDRLPKPSATTQSPLLFKLPKGQTVSFHLVEIEAADGVSFTDANGAAVKGRNSYVWVFGGPAAFAAG